MEKKTKVSVYLTKTELEWLKAEALRLERPITWVVESLIRGLVVPKP